MRFRTQGCLLVRLRYGSTFLLPLAQVWLPEQLGAIGGQSAHERRQAASKRPRRMRGNSPAKRKRELKFIESEPGASREVFAYKVLAPYVVNATKAVWFARRQIYFRPLRLPQKDPGFAASAAKIRVESFYPRMRLMGGGGPLLGLGCTQTIVAGGIAKLFDFDFPNTAPHARSWAAGFHRDCCLRYPCHSGPEMVIRAHRAAAGIALQSVGSQRRRCCA